MRHILFLTLLSIYLSPLVVKADIPRPVTVRITTKLPTFVAADYDIGYKVTNLRVSDISGGALYNMDTAEIHLGLGFSGSNTTGILISGGPMFDFGGSHYFCILNVTLDPNTGLLKDASWFRKWSWHPDPKSRTKPAICSLSISGQTIDILVHCNSSECTTMT